ncbi:cytochrome P450 71D10-like [Cynara cardunculus var. scolymus]|uniref:cytochrome P450 71D10-like n=1 Tax=Cynara cardunculus var. scolymus TaxID=59895 RepID=UPI000D62EFF1|nr:cytochrome P450 71D10-like [Cynara cardunculus var. scolymus]
MELSFQIFFTFLFMLTIIKLLRRSKTGHSTPNLPPGPRKLPLIGNILDVAGPHPHRILRDLAQKHGPLMHLQLGENSTIIASSAETAKEVMKTHDINFANRPFLLAADIITYKSTNIMFSPYGDYWRQLRRICNSELLSGKHVQSLRPIREEEVSGLITAICEQSGSPFNLSEHIYALTYGITTRSVFGKKLKHQEALISLIDEAIGLSGGFSLTDLYPSSKVIAFLSGLRPKLEKIHQKFDKMLDNIIEEHKAREVGNGDANHLLFDALLKVQEHGNLEVPLTMDNIKAIILDVLSAGSDTSSTVIEWAMSELLKNPRIMERVQTEVRQVFSTKTTVDETGIESLDFLKAVIKETLRLHPPAPLMLPMENKERCEINGYEIPMKTKVVVNAWAIGRDPKYWEDPERFHPDRFLDSLIDYRGLNFEYIPFGAGRRICPGISFGLANLELPLASLLYHFDWKLADSTMKTEDLDMTEAFGATVKRKNGLNLIATVRYPPV